MHTHLRNRFCVKRTASDPKISWCVEWVVAAWQQKPRKHNAQARVETSGARTVNTCSCLLINLNASCEGTDFRAHQKPCPRLIYADEVISRLSEGCVSWASMRENRSLQLKGTLWFEEWWRKSGIFSEILCQQLSRDQITSSHLELCISLWKRPITDHLQVCSKTRCLCWLRTSESSIQSQSLC